ncbi:MAG: polyprenyl synthetase family protein [Candidatus Odinarchaeota archaeon]
MNINMEKISSNTFLNRVKEYQRKVDNAILTELDKRKESVFYEPFRNIMKGGKRLRPILLLLSFESVDGRRLNPLPAAVAVEFTHLESLIHDDIIDRDTLRRGSASFHVLYGYEQAILGADYIFSVILELITRYPDSRVAETLALATSRMCEGQLIELTAYKKKEKISLEKYVNIVYNKTASLFESAATIGAIIGGAEKEEIQILSDYGRALGIAYQIQDDLTDLHTSKINNILNLLKETETIRTLSKSCIMEAKKQLEKLKETKARQLLKELADYVTCK